MPFLFWVNSVSAAIKPPAPTFGEFVEPILGFSLGTYKVTPDGSSTAINSFSLKGPEFGVRAGVLNTSYMLAGRFQYETLSGSSDGNGISNLELGIDIGGTFTSIPLRIWFGVNLKDTLTFADGTTAEATGFKLGTSYFYKPNVAVNLTYTTRSYAKKLTASVLTLQSYDSFALSISVPFTFGVPPIPELSSLNRAPDDRPNRFKFGPQ